MLKTRFFWFLLFASIMFIVQGHESTPGYEDSSEESSTASSAGNHSGLIRDIFNLSILTISVCAFIIAAFAFFVNVY
ncbi:uncharacterized protein LOC114355989 isoform X3 [Ostrinia furnacalis]|uniref:uncharacterized protein LOC114355989 isoform X3 n=1 Tax=Ostrinia furnacalis TaxID=93504 RepID=UPI001038D424|nr:uncharacterized protein LOC114355989 isoform X3 [Ostrinia furnacalis]